LAAADIKPDNIFVKFRDPSLIESKYLASVPVPQQNKAEERYSPIPSRPLRYFYFNEEDSRRVVEFDIALGDWGVSSWITHHLTERIQPVALRAPEVLIGAPWDQSTDLWNLGALLLELYRAVRMFDGRVPPDGHYEVKQHIAEIVDLFGPFPKELLEKGNQEIVKDIFDEDGKPRGFQPLVRPPLASEAFMPKLNEEARAEFDSFLRTMMKINPAERPSTEDLLRHPWLAAMR
jgi:serine/threonine-protein kinase SRPK3